MQRIADRFDAAEEVRIVGAETDIRFSLAGRHGEVDDGHFNMPGGEVFYSPVEDSTEGVVTFSEFPAVDPPDEVSGVRFRYEGGRIVDASAESNEEALIAKLDRDEGARRLGEFGIGCNPAIQRHVKETLFDEKIYGTIHLAIGAGIPSIGGTNVSSRALGHGQGAPQRRPDRVRRRGRPGERRVDVLGADAGIAANAGRRAHRGGAATAIAAGLGLLVIALSGRAAPRRRRRTLFM